MDREFVAIRENGASELLLLPPPSGSTLRVFLVVQGPPEDGRPAFRPLARPSPAPRSGAVRHSRTFEGPLPV